MTSTNTKGQMCKKIFFLALLSLGFFVFIIVPVTAGGQKEAEKEYVIKYAGTPAASKTNPEYLAMEKFKEIVEEKSGGKIKVEIYPANQLGATKEFTEGVSIGTVEMAETGYDILGLIDPMCYALTLPYLHSSLEHYIKVIDGPIGEEINQHLIKTAGVRILGALNRGPRHMMNSVRPIRVPADLKGLKIRSPENPLNAGTVNAMGATAVPMSWGEVYTALSQGVVDGVENAIDELYNQKLHEVSKYLSLTGHIYVAVPIIINEEFYQKLPTDYQEIIKDAAMESVRMRREMLKTSEDKAIADMKKTGIQVLTDPDIEAFSATAKVVWEQFVDGKNITWELIERIRNY